jgi:hypothetical protein
VTTIYVVPCGISIFDHIQKRLADAGGGGAVRPFLRLAPDGSWLNGADLEAGDAVLAAWAGKVLAKAEAAGMPKVAAKFLSAETHTLAKRTPFGSGGYVVLLASDTRPGVSAAFCVAQYLAGFPSGKLAYVSTPRTGSDLDAIEFRARDALVTVVRVRGLKPAGTDFDLAASGIGKALRAAADIDGQVEVHLTGGYKASLLHTLAMAEVLHSMAPDRVTAWNVFEDVEDQSSDLPADPQKIGLRRFPPEYIRSMRLELTQASAGEMLGKRTFEGLGWEEDADRRRRLNAFGHGYLAILGRSPAPWGADNS